MTTYDRSLTDGYLLYRIPQTAALGPLEQSDNPRRVNDCVMSSWAGPQGRSTWFRRAAEQVRLRLVC